MHARTHSCTHTTPQLCSVPDSHKCGKTAEQSALLISKHRECTLRSALIPNLRSRREDTRRSALRAIAHGGLRTWACGSCSCLGSQQRGHTCQNN
eukprot:1150834-Pelagomonas_calceolata.AAC.2